MVLTQQPPVRYEVAAELAGFAVAALLEEVRLTPKPGLVDRNGNGSHHDLTLDLMERSARSLEPTFYDMAMASIGKQPSQYLRERLAAIGRHGEQTMLRHTGQVNTHKGAIWVLGLLTGAASILLSRAEARTIDTTEILTLAGAIARFEDSHQPIKTTNGDRVRQLFRVRSAREEATACFPSLQQTALPIWNRFRREPEPIRRLNTLLALMSVVDDTCILHRSNMEVLKKVQRQAADIIRLGGMGVKNNSAIYERLDQLVTDHWVSPGGSADLLAATIFLHKIVNHYKIN
jgi:triphosphoribosyl-dephospho-CoA synthase